MQGGVRRSTVGCAQAVVGHDRLCAPIRDMKEMAIMERDRSTESPFSLAGNALIRVLVKMAPQPPPPMILLSVLARLIWFIRETAIFHDTAQTRLIFNQSDIARHPSGQDGEWRVSPSMMPDANNIV